jgi:hypothetical protein
MASRQQAIEHLKRYAALSNAEATVLIDAVVAAAGEEAIDAIAEETPAPTAIADVRAARLVRICTHAQRLLAPTEVEVLMRVPRATAVSLINRVRASYPQRVDDWARQLIVSQANVPKDVSTDDEPDRWRVTFNDPAVLGYAMDLLRREGMTRDVVPNRAGQSLTFPRSMRDRHGTTRNLLDVLGIPAP